MAREIAHEYGHAVLPPIGGFKQPEVWVDGYLGEKLFLKWMRDDMAAKKLTPDDAMGASQNGLDAWVKKNVDPLVAKAALQHPDPSSINESQAGMDAFLGLALYVQTICPASLFVKSLMYTSSEQGTPPICVRRRPTARTCSLPLQRWRTSRSMCQLACGTKRSGSPSARAPFQARPC